MSTVKVDTMSKLVHIFGSIRRRSDRFHRLARKLLNVPNEIYFSQKYDDLWRWAGNSLI